MTYEECWQLFLICRESLEFIDFYVDCIEQHLKCLDTITQKGGLNGPKRI